jgi:NAD(P)-dependent dehydrogenase (short-subunit alcohol dehydrogenase family)
LAIEVDVSQSRSADAMVATTLAAFGQVDVLVHCAGVRGRGEVLALSDEHWREVLAVNLDGTFYATRATGRLMAARGSGTMVIIASDRGLYGSRGGSNYAASKGAVIAYVKSLALELGPRGVTVNAINPGTTDTPQAHKSLTEEQLRQKAASDPLGRISTPENIAEIILFLAGPGGKFMTGQLLTTRMRVG